MRESPTPVITQTGAAEVNITFFASGFWGSPIWNLSSGGNGRNSMYENLFASPGEEVPNVIRPEITNQTVAAALDDFRRLGLLDLQLNHPATTVTVAPLKSDDQDTVTRGVQVKGNQLVEIATGRPIQLRGVNHAGAEYMCVGDRGIFEGPADAEMVAALKSWGNTVVRMPLNEDCWLGINGVPAVYSAQKYQDAVSNFVHLFADAGLIVILDLHWSAPGDHLAKGQNTMPDRSHAIDFWTGVAKRFGNNNAVIFDLFNEPYPGGAFPGKHYPAKGKRTCLCVLCESPHCPSALTVLLFPNCG